MASERRLGIGSKARRLECGGRNKVEPLWVRVEDPAGSSTFQPVTSFVSFVGGQGRHLFASYNTQPCSRTTQSTLVETPRIWTIKRRSQTSSFPFRALHQLDQTLHAELYTAVQKTKHRPSLWHRLRPLISSQTPAHLAELRGAKPLPQAVRNQLRKLQNIVQNQCPAWSSEPRYPQPMHERKSWSLSREKQSCRNVQNMA
jgi:hypothetical protein